MTRSVWKGPFVDGYLLKKADAARSSGRHEMIRIWSRRSTILPQFVGLTFGVYNGQKHVPVTSTRRWSVTSSASSPRRARSTVTRRTAKPNVPAVVLVGEGLAKVQRRRRPPRRRAARREAGRTSMSKKKRERALSDNEAKAVSRNLRVSPQKLNLLAQLIRGKKVATALADLEFSRKRIARDVRKCLESAIANAENNHDLDVDDLMVVEAHVGKGAGDEAAFAACARPRRSDFQAVFPPHHRGA